MQSLRVCQGLLRAHLWHQHAESPKALTVLCAKSQASHPAIDIACFSFLMGEYLNYSSQYSNFRARG